MTTALTIHFDGSSAVFAGADVCREAGLPFPDGCHRSLFEDDVWDFNEVIGLPVQLPICHRHLDFTGIRDLRWRLVAKELLRPVWAEHADRTKIFIGQLGTTRKTERTRLQADHDRALRVVAEIDAASSTTDEESA